MTTWDASGKVPTRKRFLTEPRKGRHGVRRVSFVESRQRFVIVSGVVKGKCSDWKNEAMENCGKLFTLTESKENRVSGSSARISIVHARQILLHKDEVRGSDLMGLSKGGDSAAEFDMRLRGYVQAGRSADGEGDNNFLIYSNTFPTKERSAFSYFVNKIAKRRSN